MKPDTTQEPGKDRRDRLACREDVIAEEMDLSLAFLRADRRGKRLIPFYKIGSSVRYNINRVREAIATHEVGGAAPRKGGRTKGAV